jgi:hypothetical protein
LLVTLLLVFAGSTAMAQTKEPITLRDVGSFHLGVSGKPVREVTIGGATQKLDPNGTCLVEQMYVQYQGRGWQHRDRQPAGRGHRGKLALHHDGKE